MVLLSLVPGKFAIQKEFVPDTNAPNRTTRALSAHTDVGADETRQVSPIAPNERWPYAKYRVNAISATSRTRLGSSGYSLLRRCSQHIATLMDLQTAFADTDLKRIQPAHGLRNGIIVGLLLLLFIGLALTAVEQKSPTVDENFHLLAGYSHLQWGDYRINPEHPPLAKLMAALPLLLLDINDAPLSREERDKVHNNVENGWRLANRWLFSSNDAETLFRYARVPMLLVGALLGLLICAWAGELYGLTAAFAALVFFVFDPNMLAYAPLVHTDLTFTLTFFGGTYFLWRTLREMTWFNDLLTLAFFSASAITKFSFVMVPLIWAILSLVTIVSSESLRCRLTTHNSITVTSKWAKARWIAALFFIAFVCAYLHHLGSLWIPLPSCQRSTNTFGHHRRDSAGSLVNAVDPT